MSTSASEREANARKRFERKRQKKNKNAEAREAGAEYAVNETVFCYHGPVMYEAKVLAVDLVSTPAEPQYLVHYQGWSKSWDEYVPADRLKRYTYENRRLEIFLKKEEQRRQKEKRDAAAAARALADTAAADANIHSGGTPPTKTSKAKSKKSTSKSKSKSTGSQGGKKRGPVDDSVGGRTKRARPLGDRVMNDNVAATAQLRRLSPGEGAFPEFEFSQSQLEILATEEDKVVMHRELVPLPRRPSVSSVLKAFLLSNGLSPSDPGFESSPLYDIVNGVRSYFNQALGMALLYRYERVQYINYRSKHADEDMADVYGAEHLLRLFVVLPRLLTPGLVHMDDAGRARLRETLQSLLEFLDLNPHFFVNEYVMTPPWYQRCSEHALAEP